MGVPRAHVEPETAVDRPAASEVAARPSGYPSRGLDARLVLRLQRTAGNAAATRAVTGARSPLAVARETPAEFRKNLGSTDDQKKAIDALFGDTTFLALWDYLKSCTATPKGDLGPLSLKVTPGLKIRGVERFGGYSPLLRRLEINPTKPEHKANPAELVDTIVHELIHAVDDLASDCKKATGKDAPLAGAATANPPTRAEVKTPAEDKKLMEDLGPGASNPCEEFIDINKAAQQMIVGILRSNIKIAKVGTPTIVFVNEILRRDPKAMAAYTKCRDVACKKPTRDEQRSAMATCSADILAKFMPKELKP